MLQILSSFSCLRAHIKQVPLLSSLFSALSTNYHFSTVRFLLDPPSPSHLGTQTNQTHFDPTPSVCCFSGISQSVISRCSHILEKNIKGKNFADASIKDLLLEISDIVPEYTRRFRRVSVLKPDDVLELLLGFQFECSKVGYEARKVEPLWELFKWANGQGKSFKHLPQSCEVMASILVRVGLLREVELLLSTMESQEISLDGHEIFSDLIEGYAGAGELERAISIYDQIRKRGLVPSLSCLCVLLDHLVGKKKTLLAFQICLHMVENYIGASAMPKTTLDNVTRLLCAEAKIQEARNLVKKAMASGFKVSDFILNEVAYGYCEKRDFADILSFFAEIKCEPDISAGNRIIHSLCSFYGTERAELFVHELEHLGFIPDEITFGILINWSCREGKLKSSFIYLSEMFSRGLKPHICSYNALISGLFQKGMWEHARVVFDEMVERGTSPDIWTYKTLLAGYCKARQFDEVKMTVCKMENCGLIQNSSLEDKLSKAFLVLGLNPLGVRLKRDNHVGFSKTEFFDNLGNGLYLDTDLDEYERRITAILEDSVLPDYNALVMKDCDHGNLEGAVMLLDEMVHWGQELSLSVFSALLKGLCASRYHIKAIADVLERKLQLVDQLDQETLNLLVQAYGKKGLTYNGVRLFHGMFQRNLKIKNETYTAMITSLCKKGNLRDFHCCWDIAREDGWIPGLKDCTVLVQCLCKKEMVKEALQLLEIMLVTYPHLRPDVCHVFLGNLSAANFTIIAHILLEELKQRGCIIDNMAYSHILRGMCKEKKFSVAFEILDNMLAKHLAPCLDVCVLLIPQLCRAGRLDKVIALKEIGFRDESFLLSMDDALIKGFCLAGKVEDAATLFHEMLSRGLLPDAEIYDILVQGFSRGNNLRKVWEFLGVMIRRNFNLSISTYRKLACLMCMEGRVHHALSLKELILDQSKLHDITIYNVLVFCLFSTGNNFLVNNVLDDLQENNILPDEVTYNFLVYGFSQCKDVKNTMHYMSTMISKELTPSKRSLRAAIVNLCNTRELEKALELSREMELRGWVHDSIIQNAIVEGLLSDGRLQEAEAFLDRLVDKCLIPENINYDNLIKSFCQRGRLKKAVTLLDIMLKKGKLPNLTSYDSLIGSFCADNKLDKALDFHTEMLDRNLKPSTNTWGMLVHNLCQDGRTAEAERVLNSMIHIGETPSQEMYSSVINRYRSENNLRKASDLMQAMQQSGYEPDFETHWSLISNLSNSGEKDIHDSGRGFLQRLLSESGFSWKTDSKAKLG
ncbi:hypothetical protein FEM48_Zijuj04G0046100 [Ziziphus jujuba var. spinosa]|uniref:Pentatricopeptide repeat-containing protein At5g15280, mitochondrial n=1 Tax=Ziziphus jujuba var. spinosa TaxID=714518 RepID=A0A978VHU5_ZIZJJ|nr:hypothetical protein FEM48_Zijuj04G0046100 [Ziziphus jujuba var. spinosa]